MLLILKKDLLVLKRSPLLLAVLLAYPLVIAALISLVATYVGAKARVALVDQDNLPKTIVIGGHRFHVDRTIDEVSKNVKLVRLDADEADEHGDRERVGDQNRQQQRRAPQHEDVLSEQQ